MFKNNVGTIFDSVQTENDLYELLLSSIITKLFI